MNTSRLQREKKVMSTCALFQVEVLEIALDQCGSATERKLAMVDKNRDLFLTSVRIFGAERKSTKMGKTSCFQNILGCVFFGLFILLWYCFTLFDVSCC